MLSDASAADGFFQNIVAKEEIAQNEQFLLLPQCFPLLVIGYPFNHRDFLFFDKICSKLSAAVLSYEGKGLPFPTCRDTFWCIWSRQLLKILQICCMCESVSSCVVIGYCQVTSLAVSCIIDNDLFSLFRLEKEYTVLKTKENEDQIELRVSFI